MGKESCNKASSPKHHRGVKPGTMKTVLGILHQKVRGTFPKAVLMAWRGRQVLAGAEEGTEGRTQRKPEVR